MSEKPNPTPDTEHVTESGLDVGELVDVVRPGDTIVLSNGEERRVVTEPKVENDGAATVRAAKAPYTRTPARVFLGDVDRHIPRGAESGRDTGAEAVAEPLLDEPEAPDDLPEYVVGPVGRQSPDALESLAEYARGLAAYKRQEADEGEFVEVENGEGQVAEALENVDVADVADVEEMKALLPSKISAHIKTIPTSDKKEKRYWYANWREGGEHHTKYLGPVADE